MIKVIISSFLILFGVIGFLLEMGRYFGGTEADLFGVIMASILMSTGFFVFFWPRIRSFAATRDYSEGISKKQEEKVSSPERSFLIIAGVIELVIGVPVLIFIFVLGLQGIIAGEMVTMIGFFSVAMLLVSVPYIFLRGLTLYGLIKRRIWSICLALISGVLYLLVGIFMVFTIPFLSLVFFVYSGFTIWAGIRCHTSPDFAGG